MKMYMYEKGEARRYEDLIKDGYIQISIYYHPNKVVSGSSVKRVLSNIKDCGDKLGASKKSKIDFCIGESGNGCIALFAKPLPQSQ